MPEPHQPARRGRAAPGPPAGLPDDARALARLQRERIDGWARRSLALGNGGQDVVLAHLLEIRARVRRALDAALEASPKPAG